MEKTIRQVHGGDRYRNQVKLDFSVNTNPFGMPAAVKRIMREAVGRYPDQYCGCYPDPACSGLRRALEDCYGISAESIVCGNGASELIYAVVNAVDRECRRRLSASARNSGLKAVLPVPSFGEYERALHAVGAQIQYHTLRAREGFAVTEELLDELSPNVDLLILCNPGNPVGNLIADEVLERILDLCGVNGTVVLLDECFLELTAADDRQQNKSRSPDGRDCSCVAAFGERMRELTARRPNVILLKAFTKLYAIPGLRLGYCVCSAARLLRAVRAQLPCWDVSGIAQLAGMTALDSGKNTDYISQSRAAIAVERKFLAQELDRHGMLVLSGQANFICFYNRRRPADDLYAGLLDTGILIRDCGSFAGMDRGWYRIAVRPRWENVVFITELGKLTEYPG